MIDLCYYKYNMKHISRILICIQMIFYFLFLLHFELEYWLKTADFWLSKYQKHYVWVSENCVNVCHNSVLGKRKPIYKKVNFLLANFIWYFINLGHDIREQIWCNHISDGVWVSKMITAGMGIIKSWHDDAVRETLHSK